MPGSQQPWGYKSGGEDNASYEDVLHVNHAGELPHVRNEEEWDNLGPMTSRY